MKANDKVIIISKNKIYIAIASIIILIIFIISGSAQDKKAKEEMLINRETIQAHNMCVDALYQEVDGNPTSIMKNIITRHTDGSYSDSFPINVTDKYGETNFIQVICLVANNNGTLSITKMTLQD